MEKIEAQADWKEEEDILGGCYNYHLISKKERAFWITTTKMNGHSGKGFGVEKEPEPG